MLLEWANQQLGGRQTHQEIRHLSSNDLEERVNLFNGHDMATVNKVPTPMVLSHFIKESREVFPHVGSNSKLE